MKYVLNFSILLFTSIAFAGPGTGTGSPVLLDSEVKFLNQELVQLLSNNIEIESGIYKLSSKSVINTNTSTITTNGEKLSIKPSNIKELIQNGGTEILLQNKKLMLLDFNNKIYSSEQ